MGLIQIYHSGDRLKKKVLWRRAKAREALGKVEEALVDLGKIEEIEPGNVEAKEMRRRLEERGVRFVGDVEEGVGNGDGNGVRERGEEGLSREDGSIEERRVGGRARIEPIEGGEMRRKREGDMNGYHRNKDDDEKDDVDIKEAVREVRERLVRKVPTTCSEFNRAWRSLFENNVERGFYLVKIVGKDGIQRGVLGAGATAGFLMSCFTAMEAYVQEANNPHIVACAEVVLALRCIDRYELIVMFLSRDDKEKIRQFVEKLISKGLDEDLARQLRSMFL